MNELEEFMPRRRRGQRPRFRDYIIALARRTRARRVDAQAHQVLLAVNNEMADAEHDLRKHQANEGPLIDELGRLAHSWMGQDPGTWGRWAKHMTIAEHCSDSKSRRLHISRWFELKVPNDVYTAVENLSVHYDEESRLVKRLRNTQIDAGEVRRTTRSLVDDEVWAEEVSFYTNLGYDLQGKKYQNGFHDYNPKGEGIAMLKHMMANFEARKTRLQHCEQEDFAVLTSRFRRWTNKAYQHAYELPNGENVAAARNEAIMRLSIYMRNPIQYNPASEDSINDITAAQNKWATDCVPDPLAVTNNE